MDKRFPTPRDVGNASQDDVARVLHRVLRTLDRRTEFMFQADFEFANGYRGPLLMVGTLRGAWREYLRRNASGAGFAAGECEVRRGDGGRVLVDLVRNRGRGGSVLHLRALNAGPMRAAGGEARFVDAFDDAGAGAAPAAGDSASPAPADAGEAPPAAPDPDRVRADHAALMAAFDDFKSKPTTEKLASLTEAIARWKRLRDALPDPSAEAKATRQIDAMEKLLAEKGSAYVTRASS